MNCANHPDRERIAFCQNCGKPLCQECTRTVGSAVFCEPCLVAKLAGANAPNPAAGPIPGATYPVDGTIPPPPAVDEPNPGLAALLGFIPGVGAMYNGQYAKGIVHLIVFAVLVSLAGENGIFGLFIAGWVFYQVIEAHHTAQARRDGTPLPNPFGLNDLGERLGFGKAWPGGIHGGMSGQTSASAPDATVPPVAGYPPPAPGYPPYTPPPPTPSWDAPWENYVAPGTPFVGAATPPADLNPPYSGNRFPTGAIWLIALGAIFLIGNSGLFHGHSIHWFVPLLLIGFGVWQFVRKMTDTGSIADDGTAAYKFRLFHALRGSIWIMLVGVLFLLDSSHILSWGRSWPLFIIVAGVMAVLQRAAFSAAAAAPYPYPYPAAPPPGPVPTTTTSVVPSNTHDQEGK
ncbi:B-box zinc finger protein [Edaphobacter paludis]|uniref:B-box zinc finger protein n=1 Tax=Edaphobacter paludis TaxID=3035702 RepID=A0AAU7CZG2_9BACT